MGTVKICFIPSPAAFAVFWPSTIHIHYAMGMPQILSRHQRHRAMVLSYCPGARSGLPQVVMQFQLWPGIRSKMWSAACRWFETTITGLLKGNGTALAAATAGTDYQSPLNVTNVGSSGAATLSGNTLNIPIYSGGGGGSGTAFKQDFLAGLGFTRGPPPA
jgi:hypothetical protein